MGEDPPHGEWRDGRFIPHNGGRPRINADPPEDELVAAYYSPLRAPAVAARLGITLGQLYACWRALRRKGAITGAAGRHGLVAKRSSDQIRADLRAKHDAWAAKYEEEKAMIEAADERAELDDRESGWPSNSPWELRTDCGRGGSDPLLERLRKYHGAGRPDVYDPNKPDD